MSTPPEDLALKKCLRKIIAAEALQRVVAGLQAEGKRVVWTNGCFDLLHAGHVTYLLRASEEGDALVIGLNSDASVRENKGPGRPVVGEQDRALVLSALGCVDYIVIFPDKTPMPLLERLRPDVYAKGGDYTIDTIVQEERRLVEGHGGRIALIPGVEGKSSTRIIEKASSPEKD